MVSYTRGIGGKKEKSVGTGASEPKLYASLSAISLKRTGFALLTWMADSNEWMFRNVAITLQSNIPEISVAADHETN